MPSSQECLSISLERYSYLFPSEWRLSAERYFGGGTYNRFRYYCSAQYGFKCLYGVISCNSYIFSLFYYARLRIGVDYNAYLGVC